MSAFDIPERSRPGPSLEHPRKDASLQKRKQGDIDDESGHCGPNKKNRNEEDDDHSAKKKAAAMWQSRLEYTRRAYQQWTDAYKGEHTRALGSDSPSNYGNKQAAEALSTPNIPNSTHSSSADLIPMYRMTECLVLYSFSDRTIVPMADKESNRYVYRPASQNPRFEICWGKKVPDMSLNLVFTPLARMYISPECMVSLPSRKHVASPDMVSLMDTLGSLQLPALDGQQQKGVDVITFRVKPADLYLHHELSEHRSSSADSIWNSLQQSTILSITVIRASIPESARFSEEFWDDQAERCLEKGIYWGYNFTRPAPPLEDFREVPYTEQLLRGWQPMIHLPWLKSKQDSAEDKLGVLDDLVRFTSIEEWAALHISGFIQDTRWQHMLAKSVYNWGPESTLHQAMIRADPEDPTHYYIYLDVEKTPGLELPRVPPGAVFSLKCYTDEGEETLEAHIEVTLVKAETRAKLLLEHFHGNKHRPWGEEWYHGGTYKVKAILHFNISSPLRQLRAIEWIRDCGEKHLQDLILCRKPNVDSLKSIKAAIDTYFESRPEALAAFKKWHGTCQITKLQQDTVDAALSNYVSVVSGPPGSGKSLTAMNAALHAAISKQNVLIASPTNAAGKAIAAKFVSAMESVPTFFRDHIRVIYFSTVSEAIGRLMESIDYKPKTISSPSDDIFEDFQLWRHIISYAQRRLANDPRDERAKVFLQIYKQMQDVAETGIYLQPNERDFFKKTFQILMRGFMSLTDKTHIVISTCNNSAYFKELNMKFPLIFIGDAAAAWDADLAVALQIQHDGLVLLGECKQGRPVVVSKGWNESYKWISQSLLERSVRSGCFVTTTLL